MSYRYREALAKLLMKNEDYDAALTEYSEAAKLAPNAFFAEEMDNQRIELYRRQGTLVEKIEIVEVELKNVGTPRCGYLREAETACQDVSQVGQHYLRARSPLEGKSTSTRRYNCEPMACRGLHQAE